MKRFIIKFLIISISVFIVAETLILFIESKKNGFFTQVASHSMSVSEKKNSVEITFTADENYLGTVALPLSSQNRGNVRFRVKEKSANVWYHQSETNSEAFNQLSPYPFGFAVLPYSQGKQYVITIDPVGSARIHTTGTQVQAKYLYPKAEITNSKKVLVDFIFNKYYHLFLGSPIWFFSLLFAFVVLKFRQTLVSLLLLVKKLSGFLYVVPLLLFILSVVFLLVHDLANAEKMVDWVWVAVAIVILQFLFKNIKKFIEKKSDKTIQKYIINSFFILSFIALIIAAFNKIYMLGGDDSRTFFLYPVDFLMNQASHVGPDGAVSSLVNFLPPTSIAAFIIFIIFLKAIFFSFNLQMILFVGNIIGGVVFFYFLLDYLLPDKSLKSFYAKGIGSLLYVFSIFNFYTLFNSQLISMYLISTFPLCIYLYIKGIKEAKFYLLALIAVIGSVFSFFVVSLPWFLAGIIAMVPVFLHVFWKQKKRFFIYTVLLFFIFLLLNAYWIYALPFSLVAASSISHGTAIASSNFRQEYANGIVSTTEINKVFFPLLNLYHYNLQFNFHWPFFPIFTSWYLKFLPLNSLLIIIVLFTGIKMKESSLRRLYIAGVISLLVSIYFFTVNIGSSGINIFLYLNDHIPGFVMFRNMYDKFGFGIAISFAFLITVCLQYILHNEKNSYLKKGILICTFLLILFNAKPFLFNNFYSIPIWTTTSTYNSITGFNHDYLDLVRYIKENDNASRYLWLPLNNGNISQIQDEKESDHYYSGVSPLLFLSGKNDYSGVTSFDVYSKEIATDIYKRKYADLGELYRRFNVKYIIINHTITSDIKQSYICGEKICDAQDKQYEKAMLGKKIKDFGSRYSLYEINPKYANDKLSLQEKTGYVSYKKVTSDEYTVKLSHVPKNTSLVFLDPYFPNWEIVSQNKQPVSGITHSKIYNYANVWNIHTDALIASLPESDYRKNDDGTVDLSVTLLFKKSSLYLTTIYISIITYAVIIGYGFVMLVLYLRRKFKK